MIIEAPVQEEVDEVDEVADFLEHYGVKGMKWGQRKAGTSTSKPSGKEVRTARKELQSFGGNARAIIREGRRADTPAARKAAAKKYEKEILNKIKDPEFKKKYETANKVTKGEMAVQIVAFGPLAALTIPAIKAGRKGGYDYELDVAHEVLREMQRP